MKAIIITAAISLLVGYVVGLRRAQLQFKKFPGCGPKKRAHFQMSVGPVTNKPKTKTTVCSKSN
jgi:hypothetical protein